MKKSKLIITLFLFLMLIFSAFIGNLNNNNDNFIKAGYNNINDDHLSDKNSDTPLKVVIDPGHGGIDVGAQGASGQYEKDFTLSVSKRIEKLLEQETQIQVFMTRKDDSFISQESRYRPKYANNLNADLFISIHGNTFTDPNVSGTETYYYHRNSRQFAEIIQEHVADATGFRDRGIMKKDLFVVKDTKMTGALIEVGYLTNPQEESKMWADEFQNRVATAIVEGIKEYIYAEKGVIAKNY